MSFKNRILLSAMLPTLTARLGAKCPTNFVEAQGKIESGFKPDARVPIQNNYPIGASLLISKCSLLATQTPASFT